MVILVYGHFRGDENKKKEEEQGYEQEEKTITASDGIAFDRELSAGDAKLCGRVHCKRR